MKTPILIALALLGTSLGRAPQAASIGYLVVPPECILSISKTDKTFCSGPDAQHMLCKHINLEYRHGCERWDVKDGIFSSQRTGSGD